ncbi:hypothetical protein ACWDUI_30365 [Streptosporangium sandarakinum]
MPELIVPTTRLHAAWLEARAEWGPGVHEDGFGLLPADEVGSPAGFAAWVARLTGGPDHALDVVSFGDTAVADKGCGQGDEGAEAVCPALIAAV